MSRISQRIRGRVAHKPNPDAKPHIFTMKNSGISIRQKYSRKTTLLSFSQLLDLVEGQKQLQI